MSELTPQEREAIKSHHPSWRLPHSCYADGEPWPCLRYRLVARIEELEKVVGDARALHQPVNFDPPVGEVCRACWTDEWPCETRAALGGEDG